MEFFHDGFGTRALGFDPESGDPVEILSFAPQLVEAPEFAAAVGERVARLARVRHTSYARARRLDRPAVNSLHLLSDHTPGWRLADMLRVVERENLMLEIGAILALLRQLIPAVALFSRHQRDASIGTIGVERLIVTPQSRLVRAAYVLAPGHETLHVSRERLWRDYRVVLPVAASPSRIPPSADVVGMGVVAVSLLLGRLLKDDEYLVSLGDLFESLTETSGGTSRKVSPGFCTWIARALQFDEKTGFQSPQEAHLAFEEMLAKERGYVTTPAHLESFVARFEKLAGPPASARREPEPSFGAVGADSARREPGPSPVAASPASARREPEPSFGAAGPGSARREPEPSPTATLVAPVAPAAFAAPSPPTAPLPPTAPSAAVAPVEDSSGVPLRVTSGGRRWLTRALVGLAALVVIEAAAIAWLLTRDAGSGLLATGELLVQSRPVAARVTIDGEERGITPFSMELSPGAHILEVRVGRSEPRVIPVLIRAGVQSGLYVELQSVAMVGALDVRSDPPKARVTVDGQYRGDTPFVIRDLPPGDHEVLIEGQGRQARQTVRVEPGITSQLIVPLGAR